MPSSLRSFNSSVGILSVGTCNPDLATSSQPQVSIPQSEFCPLGRSPWYSVSDELPKVSIPQSEFCPLGLNHASATR